MSHGRRVAGVDEVLGVDGEGIDRREVGQDEAQSNQEMFIFRLLGGSLIQAPVQTSSSNRKCSFSRYFYVLEEQLYNNISLPVGLQREGGAGVLLLLSVRGGRRGQEEPRHGRPAQRRPHCQLHHRGLCGFPLHRGWKFLYPPSLPGRLDLSHWSRSAQRSC